MVLVIVVLGFIVIQPVLELLFHAAVGGFRCQHIRILQGIGGGYDAGGRALKERGAGGYAGHKEQDHGGNASHDEKALFMPHDKGACLFRVLGGASCGFRRRLGRFRGIPRAVSGFCGGVFLFDCPFLLPFGIRVGSLPVFLFVLPVQGSEVCFIRSRLRFFRSAVGLLRMRAMRRFRNAVTTLCGLGQRVCRLRTGVAVIIFSELPVNRAPDDIQRRFFRQMGQLGGGTLLIHLLKEKARRDLACFGVHNALFHLYGLFRDFGFCLLQLIRRLVRLADDLFKRRRSAFFLGEVQPGCSLCHRQSPQFPAVCSDSFVVMTLYSSISFGKRSTKGRITLP